jgi:hypothetical protein
MAAPIHTGRTRDAMILALASEWVVFAKFLVNIGLFPSKKEVLPTKKAMERLTKLERDKKLTFAGRVMLRDVGHPTHCFTNRETGNCLEHDAFVSLIASLYWAHHPTMTWTGKERADLRWSIGKEIYLAEYDNDHEGDAKLRSRIAEYKGTRDNVLWIATSNYRCQKLHRFIKELGIKAFVGRLADVLADPYGRVYVDPGDIARKVSTPVSTPVSTQVKTGA